jgi:YidC/Oxa1 family membrane protein insertase
MEKRVLAAIAISIAILFAFRYIEERRLAEQSQRAAPPTPAEKATPPPVPVPKPARQVESEPAEAPVLPPEEIVAEQKVIVEGNLYRAVLDNRGAVITSWVLKDYKTAGGEIFDMVPSAHMEERPYPASLIFDDPEVTATANETTYAVEIEDGREVGNGLQAPVSVVMRLRRGDVLIEKRFRFEEGNYLVHLTASFRRGSDALAGKVLLGQDIGPELEHLVNPSTHLTAISDHGGKVQRKSAPKEENQTETISGPVRWVGLDIKYFAEIAIPEQPAPDFEITRRDVETQGVGGKEVTRQLIQLAIPTAGTSSFLLYLGPKMQAYLNAVPGAELSRIIDYGMFTIIVKPLLVALKYINNYAHNYGLAIIFLTFILTLALFPIRLKQMLSMKKMQALQPKIKAIQEKYKRYKKTDPKRAEQNQEIMALYKEHNVNPLGGCLPMILQMPLLIAFYSLLGYSIEIRQAPFIGWIHDLSLKDPYYILPLVMGITMLISQRMTPMSPGSDPTQAKMMMIMPAIFTILFLNVSSGLNLYFLCSNVFQIAFQKVSERWIGDRRAAQKAKGRG